MKKQLLHICILILMVSIISCATGKSSAESYMTEDVFAVGDGAEVTVSIEYKKNSFDVILTIKNVSEKILLVNETLLLRIMFLPFVKSNGNKGFSLTPGCIDWESEIYPDSFVFLAPHERLNYKSTYTNHRIFLGKTIGKTMGSFDIKRLFAHTTKVYFEIRYNNYIIDRDKIKAGTNEYFLEPFEKKYLLELDF